jgi:hypothetical protein
VLFADKIKTVGKVLSSQIRIGAIWRHDRPNSIKSFYDIGSKSRHSVGSSNDIRETKNIDKPDNPVAITRWWTRAAAPRPGIDAAGSGMAQYASL